MKQNKTRCVSGSSKIIEHEKDRIISQLMQRNAELQFSMRVAEAYTKELEHKIDGWIRYSEKLQTRLDTAKHAIKNAGMSETAVRREIKR